MTFEFFKYQGTGNDFILIDNRSLHFFKNDTKFIKRLCDRKFGIGADGLILLESHPNLDFSMVYYNSDGNLSTMCGNGGRCLVQFAKFLGIVESKTIFEAVDGIHEATIDGDNVALGMNDVEKVSVFDHHIFLNTGSPHHVQSVGDLHTLNVTEEGRKIRTELYGSEGANVNFVTQTGSNTFQVRTYERGVENETLSCGTGVTAVAIAMHEIGLTTALEVTLLTQGGPLKVRFQNRGGRYEKVSLIGPAEQVFKGFWS